MSSFHKLVEKSFSLRTKATHPLRKQYSQAGLFAASQNISRSSKSLIVQPACNQNRYWEHKIQSQLGMAYATLLTFKGQVDTVKFPECQLYLNTWVNALNYSFVCEQNRTHSRNTKIDTVVTIAMVCLLAHLVSAICVV